MAVALQWLQQNDESSHDTNSAGKATKPPDCRAWLMKQDKATLVNLLLEEAELNEELHSRLLFGAAAAATDFELATHKKIIRQAIDCSEFVEYGDVYDYWRRAYTVIDGIEALLDQDRAKAVIELCEYALRRVEQAIEVDSGHPLFQPCKLWVSPFVTSEGKPPAPAPPRRRHWPGARAGTAAADRDDR